MMKYKIVAVGTLKRSALKEARDFYRTRLQPLADIELLEVKEGKGEKKLSEEAEYIKKHLKGKIILLSEHGQEFSSAEWAGKFEKFAVQGESEITFVIGGADGLAKELLETHLAWSLSELTFSHDLAQVILLEQLYRAEQVLSGHPYHRAG